jgi:hypothetical protein
MENNTGKFPRHKSGSSGRDSIDLDLSLVSMLSIIVLIVSLPNKSYGVPIKTEFEAIDPEIIS